MKKSDVNEFSKLWTMTLNMYGKTQEKETVALVFSVLIKYELEDIKNALWRFMSESKFAPMPADIIKIIESSQGENIEAQALNWLARLDSKLDRAFDYVSTDWRGVQAFKAVYGNLNAYCDWPEFYESQARKSFVEEYKVAFKLNDIAEDHLIQGLYHKNRPTVRMLETLEESKAILRQLYDPRKVTLSYQPFDPAKPKALPKPQRPQLQCSLEEQQANLTQLETLLKQMSTAMKPSYSNKGII